MYRTLLVASLLCGLTASAVAQDKSPRTLVTGLKNPESVLVVDGRVYVSVIGEFGKDGDGAVVRLDDGKAVPVATDLDDPKGLASFQGWLFVADKQGVWRIDRKGKKELYAAAKDFPNPPRFLNDLVADEVGNLYVSDSGDLKGNGWAVYRVTPKRKVQLITDARRAPGLKAPNGLAIDSLLHLLVLDAGNGTLQRVNITDGTATPIADGFGVGDGLAYDRFGRLFISDWAGGKVYVLPRPGQKAVLLAKGLQSAADLTLDATGRFLLVPDMKAGTVVALPAQVPGAAVDDRPLPLETAVAFPDLKWTGWEGETPEGKISPLRPIVLTHAGDGSNRVFVATQHGVIHVFPNDQQAKQTKVFLDIQDKVRYDDKMNEEGFLGLAFHPDYEKNGEFFVFYTLKNAKHKHTNVLSRFRVSKNDPDRADPASEEEILRVERPFWNHDGGTVLFGPDGYLYLALGDGGSAGDPHNNAQDLRTILGAVLRLDVNRKEAGKNYAIPKDNPFVGRSDARPEIWAYGLRNVWRMAFDRKTGQLWAADVGQNLWEEINLLKSGGNYGWKLREGLHPFGPNGVGPRPELLDPIWEYHHSLGKSITGGTVYRGPRLPELDGAYVYADYVTGGLWALRYDEGQGRVVANRPIRDRQLPILSFGEDEQGEVYLLTYSPAGRGLYRFVRQQSAGAK